MVCTCLGENEQFLYFKRKKKSSMGFKYSFCKPGVDSSCVEYLPAALGLREKILDKCLNTSLREYFEVAFSAQSNLINAGFGI